MAWKRVVRPSVWLSFSLGNGGGLHGNDEVSDVYLVWKPGPRVARPDLGECFVGRNRVGVFVWMRRLDYCNWSALLKQSLSRFFSVCLCKVCVWVCFCACVCMCVRCPVCFSGVLTEALHGICSPPFGNTSLRRNKRRGEGRGGKKFYSSNTQSDFLIKQI